MPLDPTQTVISTLFVHDDKLYVGFADYRVSVVDLKTFNIITEITEDLWEVKAVVVDSTNIYVGSLNNQLLIYDHNYGLIKKITHELGVISVEVDNDYIYTASYDGRVAIWDKVSYEFVNSLDNHLIRVNYILVDKEYVYTGDGFSTAGGLIRKWGKEEFNLINEFSLPICKRINCMTIESSYLYAGIGGPGEIRVVDLNTEKQIKTIETRNDVKSISVNDKFMLITLQDKIQIYNKLNFELIHEISEQGREVNDAKFYGSYIIYSSRDKIKIIDASNYQLLKSIQYQRILI
ncbi:MAG: hypothetical protein GPJ54_06050 [Candidatus Heimdallarchaeota archaeon]|nr:hypothetical protein [Candidatus Heimdallarchaeota archaeon]